MLARKPATSAPELEIKFQLGAGAVEALQLAFPRDAGKVSQLHATYFDTSSHALRDQGYSLRVRRRGEIHTQTLKHRAAGGLFQRDEWESEVAGPGLDTAVLSATPAAAVLGDTPADPIFTVDVERQVHIWAHGETRVEVSFDTGTITAGERREPIAELELELLSGAPQTLFDLARALQSMAHLTLLFESKAERGYRLAGHDGVAALRATGAAVGPNTTGATAFQLIARDALVQIAGNARLLQRAHNPDVLHQMRVGLRRFRAALSVFKEILDADGLRVAREETRWLAGELSEARDLDVFLQRAAAPDEIEEDPARTAFFRALRLAQAEAYERALAAIASERFRALLFTLAEWIEVGQWRRQTGKTRSRLREGPATALVAPVMTKLDHRLRRRSRKFKDLDAEARHELRKQAKKLRYAAAFFGEAFPQHPKLRQRFVAALKTLQDRMGELNDIAVARAVALKVVERRSGELAFAGGLEVGRLNRDEEAVLDGASAALKAYRRTKPYWPPSARRNKDLNVSASRLRSV